MFDNRDEPKPYAEKCIFCDRYIAPDNVKNDEKSVTEFFHIHGSFTRLGGIVGEKKICQECLNQFQRLVSTN